MNTQPVPAEGHSSPVATRSVSRPDTDTSSAEILATARRWYERELEGCARAHRSRWPVHREWVTTYLDDELRQRLMARGWRPAHVV